MFKFQEMKKILKAFLWLGFPLFLAAKKIIHPFLCFGL